MKLKDILKYMDWLTTIVVWDSESDDIEDEPLFAGTAMDCPWWIAECELEKTGSNWDGFNDRADLGAELNHRSGIIFSVIVPEERV
jgi:hypothetical protein